MPSSVSLSRVMAPHDFTHGHSFRTLPSSAKSKSSMQIIHDLDSIRHFNDSVGQSYYREARYYVLFMEPLTPEDSLRLNSQLSTLKIVK